MFEWKPNDNIFYSFIDAKELSRERNAFKKALENRKKKFK
jgi:hypothetical protein